MEAITLEDDAKDPEQQRAEQRLTFELFRVDRNLGLVQRY